MAYHQTFTLGKNQNLKIVGYLVMFFPLIIYLMTRIFDHCEVQESISHYYYTVANSVFEVIICSIATFMFLFRGYTPNDRIAHSLAGIFAMGVALFPCSINRTACCILNLNDHTLRESIHYISAAAMFTTLACILWFLFTKSNKTVLDKWKKIRNGIYQVSSILIILSIVLIFLHSYHVIDLSSVVSHPVFFLEWTGLWIFGICWLIKGDIASDAIDLTNSLIRPKK